MAWSIYFKDYLKRFPDTEVGRTYAPEFRLQIGTPFVSGHHMGAWEKDKGTKCLEISSHPYNGSVNPSAAYHYKGTHSTGYEYLYCVGLSDRITFGKQSVNPRTFVYTGSTLSCEVTQYAASAAAECLIGTLACLQIRFSPDTMGAVEDSVYGHLGEAEWQNIFVGTYKGMKWNGASYMLSFDDALTAARQNITDPQTSLSKSDANMWFKGCGVAERVRETETDFTDGSLLLDVLESYTDEVAFGKTGNRLDTGMWGWDEMHRQPHVDADSMANMWASVRNASGNTTYVHYSFFNVSPGSGGGPTSPRYLNLKHVNSTSSFGGYYPGRKNKSADLVSGGLGADSMVTPVCVISGSPVQAFVNTVYVRGYHENMVPGLFGPAHDEVFRADILNWPDIYMAQREFIANWKKTRAGIAYADGTSSSFDAPFKMVATKASSNGLSIMSKACGKWGVHPRFKEGSYGMACFPSATSVSLLEDELARRATLNVINMEEIEGAEWQQQEDATKATYVGGRYETTALDSPAEGTATHTTATSDHILKWQTEWNNDEFEYFDLPIQGRIVFTTNDCAEGSADRTAEHFTKIMKVPHKYVYGNAHMGVTVRLVGLRFAHIAPGDFVDIMSNADRSVTRAHVEWGPVNAGASGNLSFLATRTKALTARGRRVGNPYFVKSTHCDWVRGIVTLELTRGYDGAGTWRRRGEWGSTWDGLSEAPQRDIAEDLGMPLFNDDIDEVT